MKLQKPIIFQYVVTAKVDLMALFFSTRVVYTKTIIIIIVIHPGVHESGGYFPHRFMARQISTTNHLHLIE